MATELTAMSLNGGNNMSVKQPLLNGAADEAEKQDVLAGADNGIEEDIAMAKRQEETKGYTDAEAAAALDRDGPNELEEKEENALLQFLGYFWGPMPIMIWIAIIIEVVKAATTGDGWEDFGVLLVLQVLNGVVGWYEEMNAGNAIKALKERLAPSCYVYRNGAGMRTKARCLVRGDLIGLKIGDVVPADCILVGPDMKQNCEIDQAALTGESLPVIKYTHERLLMGSVVKRGEQDAVVTATGPRTFFGKAAGMINSVESTGRFQQILFRITLGLLGVSLVMCLAMFIKLIVVHEDGSPQAGNKYLRAVSVVVVLLVASIPIAMQVVCTSTMAVGSRRLAEKKVIIARLSAIEELAGMTILCSDKTGTLTKNKLELRPPRMAPNTEMDETAMYFYSALASNKNMQQNDAIDNCICKKVIQLDAPAEALNDPNIDWVRVSQMSKRWNDLSGFKELDFMPFNPTDKRVEVTCLPPADASDKAQQSMFRVTKGAPQVVLRLALEDPNCEYTPEEAEELSRKVTTDIQELADRGFRCLGVAFKDVREGTAVDTENLDNNQWNGWRFQGLISLFDPPRDDTKATIEEALSAGVEVKMITGDQTAIAKETCRELGMGTNILDTHQLHGTNPANRMELVMSCNGFAEVMPEDKFDIVESVRSAGHVCGMTGDGVNDAPALKRADIGIAVEGATDAAKAAADIVLTEPGLGVIIEAMQRSRKIFQRMRNYCIYRIACTIELLLFFFVAVMFINPNSDQYFGSQPKDACWSDSCSGGKVHPSPSETSAANSTLNPQAAYFGAHFNVFTLPVIALVVITILNDGTIITIAYDKVIPEKRPQKWNLWEVCIVSGSLGLVACIGSIILLVIIMQASYANSDNWAGRIFGSHSYQAEDGATRYFVTFGEAQTLLYLKVSLSDFLTVFAARTRYWFFERRPGYSLMVAAVFATSASTILSLYWPFKDHAANDFNEMAYMSSLHSSKYGVVVTWAFCIGFFLVQDAFKVLTYYALALLDPENEQRITDRRNKAILGAGVLDMERDGRRVTGVNMSNLVTHRDGYSTVKTSEYEDLKKRVSAMEKALATVSAGAIMTAAAPAEAAIPPSLKNLLLSVVAGGAVLTAIVVAISGVAQFDQVTRK